MKRNLLYLLICFTISQTVFVQPSSAEQQPTLPAMINVVHSTFDSETYEWYTSVGWHIFTFRGDSVFAAFGGAPPAYYMGDEYFNLSIQTDVFITLGAASITLRNTGLQSYEITLDTFGVLKLHRSQLLLSTVHVPMPIYKQWITLRVLAIENIISVFIDGSEVLRFSDTSPALPAGYISIGGLNVFTSLIIFDNVEVDVAVREST